jgi:hypothetical protein
MAGYIKKIALIKGIKSGFSADGAPLSGLVKCQSYAGFLKVETSLINFAPLSEGRYLFGICDGERVITFDKEVFETEEEFNLSLGFSYIVVFCHGDILPIAEACCSRFNYSKTIYEAICTAEGKGDKNSKDNKISDASGILTGGASGIKNDGKVNEKESCDEKNKGGEQYNDEAIAEADYYEYKNNEGDGAVCEVEKEEEDGRDLPKNEDDNGAFKEGQDSLKGDERDIYAGEIKKGANNCDKTQVENEGHNFYESKREEIKKIFSIYPAEEKLASVIDGSRWAKINYGERGYYAFGEVYVRGKIKYLCYAVPINGEKNCPEIFRGKSSLINADGTFYRVIYQSAQSGEVVKR